VAKFFSEKNVVRRMVSKSHAIAERVLGMAIPQAHPQFGEEISI